MRLMIDGIDDRLRPLLQSQAIIFFQLLRKEMWVLSAHLQEVAAQIQVFPVARRLVQPHKREFDFLVAIATVDFPFRFAEMRFDAVDRFVGNLKQPTGPGRFLISDGGFDQMTDAVQFMAFEQPSELQVRGIDLIIGTQIPVIVLRRFQEFDRFLHLGDQSFILFQRDCVGCRFDPFVQIAVLEKPAVMVSFLLSSRNPEIFDHMAFFRRDGRILPFAFDDDVPSVVEDIPLEWDHFLPHQLPVLQPEAV